MNIAMREIFSLGYLPRDSIVWAGLDPDGIQCHAHLDAARVRSDPRHRRLVADIFFSILLYFKTHSDADATGLANSIWQSVRADMVDKARRDLPDEVNDALFNHCDVLERPFETLKLDDDGVGGFRQTWFIDRIMHHGSLWIGKYERRRIFEPNLSETVQNSPEKFQTSQTENVLRETKQDLPDLASDAGEGSSAQQEDLQGSSSQDVPHGQSKISIHVSCKDINIQDGGEDTLLGRQMDLQIKATMASAMMFMRNENDFPPNFNAGSIAYYQTGRARGIWTTEAEDNRVKNLVSAFDVDGPCTVATPFNSEWEVLPHPDLRAMSTCWVVEPVKSKEKRKTSISNDNDEENENEEHEVIGKTRGKKEPGEIFHPEHILSKGKSKEKIQAAESESTHDTRELEFERWLKQAPIYRVIHKVKGLWQLMDLPLQEFCFI